MKYRGIQQQIALNNTKSILYLLAFPLLLLAGTYIVLWIITLKDFERANAEFISVAPLVVVGVAIWFVISYFFNTQMIQAATHSQPLQRRDNMRVYNLTENLCMSVGMTMPKLYIIETDALNAFASGINQQTYAVTLTRGKDDKGGGALIMVVVIIVAAVVYFLSILFKLALSRSREYMADAGAVEMTHNSLALASALRKISGHSTLEEVQNDEVKELFIDYKAEGFFALFATHPPIEKRIAVLEQY